VLIALLIARHGGLVELDLGELEADAMGNQIGKFYGLSMDAVSPSRVRFCVIPKA
jgi:hypothetical protein